MVFLCFLLCLWRGKKPEDTTATAKEVRDKKKIKIKNKKEKEIKKEKHPQKNYIFLFFAKQPKLQERGENLNILCFLEAQTRPALVN